MASAVAPKMIELPPEPVGEDLPACAASVSQDDSIVVPPDANLFWIVHRPPWVVAVRVPTNHDVLADAAATKRWCKMIESDGEPVPEVRLVRGDLLDQTSLIAAVDRVQPDEVYNLAAISYVPMSWKQAEITAEVTGTGVLRMLEAIRVASGMSSSRSARNGQVRFYQASSSEMFGRARCSPQNEDTPFHPRSPYGVAKAFGHFITQNYRESYGMFAVSGILFNHESPRRGTEFVSRKVTMAAARIKLGLADQLRLGNIEARRDWGFAGDYVRAMHSMLQLDTAHDFVVGTGRTHSVRDLVERAFALVGLEWERYVVPDQSLTRPADVDHLCADPRRAREALGWVPATSFEELIEMMIESDLSALSGAQRRREDLIDAEVW